MNICILCGKIISEIEYKFIINSKNKAIGQFEIELSNKSIIKVQAFDEIADYVYKEFRNGDIVIIDGELSKNKVIINRPIVIIGKENN